jgi:hypothetical protein
VIFHFAVALEQGDYVGSSSIGASQLARPALNFQMNDSDALDDLDACKARIDIRCRAVLSYSLEYVFNRATIFDPLTVAGDGCGRMKSGAHEVSVTGAGPSDVAVHGGADRVMFNEVGVGCRFKRNLVPMVEWSPT